ncbi:MAG: hypothetical protein KGZ58_09270 [Ignavibacteriales bacterium]|nr:hypothetical protein [Ignavibacteriales bacterium]
MKLTPSQEEKIRCEVEEMKEILTHTKFDTERENSPFCEFDNERRKKFTNGLEILIRKGADEEMLKEYKSAFFQTALLFDTLFYGGGYKGKKSFVISGESKNLTWDEVSQPEILTNQNRWLGRYTNLPLDELKKILNETNRAEVQEIKEAIGEMRGMLSKVKKLEIDDTLPLKTNVQEQDKAFQDINTENELLKKKVLALRNDKQIIKANLKLKGKPTREEIQIQADKTRKKNGNLNYEKIANHFGKKDGATAKKWCEEYGIK